MPRLFGKFSSASILFPFDTEIGLLISASQISLFRPQVAGELTFDCAEVFQLFLSRPAVISHDCVWLPGILLDASYSLLQFVLTFWANADPPLATTQTFLHTCKVLAQTHAT
jgi:hypothetical protein